MRWLLGYGRSSHVLRSLFVVLWGALIWLVSSWSNPHTDKSEGAEPGDFIWDFIWGFLSNGAHVFVFGILASLVFLRLRGRSGWRSVIAVACSSVYGVVDEWHQSYVFGRHPSAWDWVTDTFGSVMFCAVLVWLLDDSVPARRRAIVMLPLCCASVTVETLVS